MVAPRHPSPADIIPMSVAGLRWNFGSAFAFRYNARCSFRTFGGVIIRVHSFNKLSQPSPRSFAVLRRVHTSASPWLRPGCAVPCLNATMGDSDFCSGPWGLTGLAGLCLGLLAISRSAGTDLLVYPAVTSKHAVRADAARTMSRPRLLSGRLLAAFILAVRTRLSGAAAFDAH